MREPPVGVNSPGFEDIGDELRQVQQGGLAASTPLGIGGGVSVAVLCPAVGKEQNMAFMKYSMSVTAPKPTSLPNAYAPPVAVGEECDGVVWDGSTWVSKATWEARAKKS